METNNIPVYHLPGTTPIPLMDRFGDLMDEGMDQHWVGLKKGSPARDALQRLTKRYGKSDNCQTGNLEIGDPRLFQAEEITFIAFFDGQIGVHFEFELDFGLSDSNEREDRAITDCNTDYVPHDEFERRLQVWTGRLAVLQETYKHTQFFLTYGEETYDGRVCLCAWTPLQDGVLASGERVAPEGKLFMISPYHEHQSEPDFGTCPTLFEIADRLIAVGMNEDLADQKTA